MLKLICLLALSHVLHVTHEQEAQCLMSSLDASILIWLHPIWLYHFIKAGVSGPILHCYHLQFLKGKIIPFEIFELLLVCIKHLPMNLVSQSCNQFSKKKKKKGTNSRLQIDSKTVMLCYYTFFVVHCSVYTWNHMFKD